MTEIKFTVNQFDKIKISANYFTEIKILLLAEKSLEDITKLEVVSSMPMLWYCNGLIFTYAVLERDDRPDEVVYVTHFYWCKSEIKKESKWEGHSVVIHDSSNVPLFEVITQRLQEKNE
jgi:hypothetical protein